MTRSSFHALALFLFASRSIYGIPWSPYYTLEISIVLIYAFAAANIAAPKDRHILFAVYLVLLLFLIIVSAFMSKLKFDQPVLMGIAARRDVLVSLIPAYFIVYRQQIYIIDDIIEKFSILLKAYILFSVCVSVIVDPVLVNATLADYEEWRLYLVDYSASLGDYRYKFFLPWAGYLFTVYYLSGRSKSRFDLVVVWLFIIWLIVFNAGRVALVSMAILGVLTIFQNLKSRRGLGVVAIYILLIPSVIAIGLMFVPQELLSNRIGGFLQAIYAVFGFNTDLIIDVSSKSRTLQFSSLISNMNFFDYVFGFGQLSSQWNGGFQQVFGRFHPADLGLFGAIAVYGVVGIIIILISIGLIIPKSIFKNRSFVPVLGQITFLTVFWGQAFFQISFVLIYILILQFPKRPVN